MNVKKNFLAAVALMSAVLFVMWFPFIGGFLYALYVRL